MVVRCAVRMCKSTSVNDKTRKFFRFPSNEQMCIEWAETIGRPELTEKDLNKLRFSYKVCDLHFDFESLERLKKRGEERDKVVPTLNLPTSGFVNPSKQTQTRLAEAAAYMVKELQKTPSPKDLEKENIVLTKHLREQHVSLKLQNLITLKKHLESLDQEKKRFIALNLYLGSPQSYRILRELLRLPSERLLHKMSIGTKLSSNILSCLETKIKSLKELEKYCIICADEIALQSSLYYQIDKDKIIGFQDIDGNQSSEPATHALVIMARGIYSNWQQPLGYCLLGKIRDHEELNKWFGVMISKVLNIGLNIVAFLPAEGSFFYDMAQTRLAANLFRSTSFTVNENKIYFVFDTHDLIKSLVNNLMKYDLEFHDKDGTKLTATWKHIQTLYTLDINRSRRLAPGLTKSHIDPYEAKNLKPEQYSEIFKKSVAAAMCAYKDLGDIGGECIGTIKLIELVNETLNAFNSRLVTKSKQMETLLRFLDFTSDVTVLENNTGKDLTNDWRTSLQSIFKLSLALSSKGCPALPMHRLNQNVLRKLLDGLQQENKNPTPWQFCRAFQKLFVTNLLKHNKRSADLDKLIIGQEDIDCLLKGYEATEVADILKVGTVDYRFDLPAHSALILVSGYLLNKCCDSHKCDMFSIYLYLAGKNKKDDVMNLNPNVAIMYPPDTFIELIQKMEESFITSLLNICDFDNIGNKILEEMKEIACYQCGCFPIEYLKKLFIRLRIFNIIRFNNKNFKINNDNPKCFSMYNL